MWYLIYFQILINQNICKIKLVHCIGFFYSFQLGPRSKVNIFNHVHKCTWNILYKLLKKIIRNENFDQYLTSNVLYFYIFYSNLINNVIQFSLFIYFLTIWIVQCIRYRYNFFVLSTIALIFLITECFYIYLIKIFI